MCLCMVPEHFLSFFLFIDSTKRCLRFYNFSFRIEMYNRHNKMYTVNAQKKENEHKKSSGKNLGNCCSVTRSQAA